jgi:hypothetical protein
MSRYTLTPINPTHEVVVGWDHPLLTYFLIVKDMTKENEDDSIIRWVGTKYREIYEVDQLQLIASRYAPISADQAALLYGDKDEGR